MGTIPDNLSQMEPDTERSDDNELPEAQQGMIIAGVAASEALDATAERVMIDGIDISLLETKKATVNIEHKSQSDPGNDGNETVGRIIYAKKVFSKRDCSSKLMEKYWEEIQLPFLFIMARLSDAAGHPGAVATAATIRDHAANKEPILCQFSIEGSKIGPVEDGIIKRTIARKVSLTLKPCNQTCGTDIVVDPQAPPGWKKEYHGNELTVLEEMEKSFPDPMNERLGSYETTISPLVKAEDLVEYQHLNIDSSNIAQHIQYLNGLFAKALDAGSVNSAPGNLSQGASTQGENLEVNQVRTVDPNKKKRKKVNVDPNSPEAQETLTKAQELYYTLQKAQIDAQAYAQQTAPQTIYFAGNGSIVPGSVMTSEGIFSCLFEDAQYLYIVPLDKVQNYSFGDMSKISKAKPETFRIISRPHALLA